MPIWELAKSKQMFKIHYLVTFLLLRSQKCTYLTLDEDLFGGVMYRTKSAWNARITYCVDA